MTFSDALVKTPTATTLAEPHGAGSYRASDVKAASAAVPKPQSTPRNNPPTMKKPEDHRIRVAADRREKMRARLIESAMLVFARRGAEGSVIDEVISVAEVSRGTFYHYFRTNEELLAAVAAEVGNQLLHIVDPVIRELPDPAARVACGIRLALMVARTHPHLAGFMVRVGPPALGAQSLATEYLPRDIRAGIASGRFGPMPPRLAFDLITGPVLAAFHTLQGEDVPLDYPQQLAQAVLMSLGVPKAAAAKAAALPLQPLQLPDDSLLVRAQARAAQATDDTPT
jgi:AcrR family transcriptional regulator